MIRVQNVYYMLAYAFQVLHEQGYKNVATEEFDNVAELLAAILCRGVSVQIKRGLIRQYLSREEALASPRGKLEIGESIKTQVIRKKQEHYKNNVDSFILVSSDSDYWGLISSLPEARFLVMIERENCGQDLKNALLNAGIFYCYIDDFYSGNAEDIKLGALFKEMERYIDQTVRLNINEMFSAALKATRIEMSSSEKKQFIAKYLKTMQMEITDDGDVVLQLKRK